MAGDAVTREMGRSLGHGERDQGVHRAAERQLRRLADGLDGRGTRSGGPGSEPQIGGCDLWCRIQPEGSARGFIRHLDRAGLQFGDASFEPSGGWAGRVKPAPVHGSPRGIEDQVHACPRANHYYLSPAGKDRQGSQQQFRADSTGVAQRDGDAGPSAHGRSLEIGRVPTASRKRGSPPRVREPPPSWRFESGGSWVLLPVCRCI